jgi:hypothetical protein
MRTSYFDPADAPLPKPYEEHGVDRLFFPEALAGTALTLREEICQKLHKCAKWGCMASIKL